MKFSTGLVFVCGLFQLIACARFSSVDQEIFQVNHELKQDLGDDMDFYQWLKLPKGAKSSYDEITGAYKKLSIKLHPDKFYQKNKKKYTGKKFKKLEKLNNERYQRLSVIGEILRSDRKQRYDFYLSNGFPKWNGQGFFYSKFKPGFFLTLFIVFTIVSILHYLLLNIQRNQERRRIDLLKEDLKKTAWPNGYPPSDFSDRKITSPALDKVFLVKGDGSIYLVEQDENRNDIGTHLVDSTDVLDPTYRDLLPYRLFKYCWNTTIGKCVSSLSITNPAPVVERNTTPEPELEQQQKKKKKIGAKMELPNGKVVYGRKRK